MCVRMCFVSIVSILWHIYVSSVDLIQYVVICMFRGGFVCFGVGLNGGQCLGTASTNCKGSLDDCVMGEEMYVEACFCTLESLVT